MPKSLFVDPKTTRAASNLSFTDIPVNQYKKSLAQEKKAFGSENLIRIFRDMSVLREFESMLNQIKTQGLYNGIETTYPGPAHLSIGQEAAAVGQAYLLTTDDFIFGSHRSHGEILAKSLSAIDKLSEDELMEVMKTFQDGKILKTLEKVSDTTDTKELAIEFILYGTLAEIFARENGFHMGLGGSMHAFFLPFGVYPNNAIVGGSAPIATGSALYKKCNNKDGIVICNIGDGALGCGPVWESMNFAAMDQFKNLWEEGKNGGMPILFNIFNNSYGMGGQTRGETMAYDMAARLGAGISPTQLHAERVDGFNPLAVIDAMTRKKELLEKGQGPALLDVITYRFSGHSTSDQNAYRSKEELDAWFAVDPCTAYPNALIKEKIATQGQIDDIWSKTRERMTKICKWASDSEISPYLDFKKDSYLVERLMYSNEKRGKFDDRQPLTLVKKEDGKAYNKIKEKIRYASKDGKATPKLRMFNLRDAISEALLDKYYEDPTMISYGEDIRDWGGAFAIYRDFAEALPYSRLFNSPISEAAIVGSSVGYALSGGRVVVELMYADFIGRAGDEIFNQLSKWQAMSAGILKMPVVLRISVGAKYGAQHSQDWTALCAHIPGLKVCFPATPYEAKGLMTSALNGTDPVVFFESQRLYDMGEVFREEGVPEAPYEITIGDTNLVRQGSDLTIITVGASLYKAFEAAETLEKEHALSAEIINLHSLVPLDYTKIIESVKKTGKVVLVSDACARGSFLNDVARNISELCFDYLDAPPALVGAQNWITPPFEFDEYFFPQATWILDAINEQILPLKGHEPTANFTTVEQMRKAKFGV